MSDSRMKEEVDKEYTLVCAEYASNAYHMDALSIQFKVFEYRQKLLKQRMAELQKEGFEAQEREKQSKSDAAAV